MSITARIQGLSSYNQLMSKNNEYINAALLKFLVTELTELIQYANENRVSDADVTELCDWFMGELIKINFLAAYVSRQITRDSEGDLDAASFKNYVYEVNPGLMSARDRVDALFDGLGEEDVMVDNIRKVRSIINQYTGENKKAVVKVFSDHMDKLLTDAQSNPQEVKEVIKKIDGILVQLQTNEDGYYKSNFTFFASQAQARSSLQPKIDAAKQLLIGLNETSSAIRVRT